jgi:sec-independent protein translocase protein TatA
MDCPPALVRQRKSMANVQTMGFFGLGAPEIIIILVAAAFLAGPQKLAELGKEAGKMSSDFKDVPAEFQKGFEEGEIEARSRVAKQMDDPAE